MLLILIPVVMMGLGITLLGVSNKYRTQARTGKAALTRTQRLGYRCYYGDALWRLLTVVSAVLLILFIFILGISRLDYAAFPAEYKAIVTTLETARNNPDIDIERAAILHEVVHINRRIAKVKYWDDSIWTGWFIPDEVAKLEFIK